jgi:hypothetical protein
MEHLLNHPALVMGVPPRSKNAKPMLVTMTTQVEIETIEHDEMVRLPSAFDDVFAYDGKFYAPATEDLAGLVKSCWEDGGIIGSHITTPGIDVLHEMDERYHELGERDFWPTPMAHMLHWGTKQYAKNYFPRFIDCAEHVGDFKKSDMFQTESVLKWRECAQEFANNVKIVGEQLFVRRHEPILIAQDIGVSIVDTGIYDTFANRRIKDGGRVMTRSPLPMAGNAFTLKDYDEAVAFAIEEFGWVPEAMSDCKAPIADRELECISGEELLVRETERLAGFLLDSWASFTKLARGAYVSGDLPEEQRDIFYRNIYVSRPASDLERALSELCFSGGSTENVILHSQEVIEVAEKMASSIPGGLPYNFREETRALRLHVNRLENAPINLKLAAGPTI